ncbi:MAG: restriction endonuclease subunit S, partial [Ruminococcus sp.]|nr:restriction endonuclease subunit S [Ruminococcus sp.]
MDFKKVKLSEICSFTTGKLNSNMAVKNGKYPFFTCSPETLRINDYAFNQEAILLAGNNANGNFNIKFYKGKFNAYQRTYVFTASEKCNLKYLYYYLKLCLEDFKRLSQGTATQFLTAKILNSFEIRLPSMERQGKIASVLSALDEKIELNNRINQNLEEQAQTIFKSWFVDFEPFGCVMPDNWYIDKLGNFVKIKRGGSPRPIQEFLSDTGYNWLKISDVTSIKSPYILKIKEHIKETGLNKTVMLKKGSLVLSNSATPAIPKILDIDSCIHDGWLYFPESLLSNEYL